MQSALLPPGTCHEVTEEATNNAVTRLPCTLTHIVGELSQMRWLIFPLATQTLVGIALTFRHMSLNSWEPDDGIRRSADWLSLGTGVIFLTSAGLGWYSYSRNEPSCWGFTGTRLLKLCLDMTGLVLFYFVLFRAKSTVSPETPEEQ
jgi:hypothetical protein